MESTFAVAERLTTRQRQLVDELVDLFLAEGFARLTLDEVAARLGCSKRTLYALADSKEQLAVRAVRFFFKRSTDQVESAIARTRSPARKVTRYLEAVAEALRPAGEEFRRDLAADRRDPRGLRAEHRRGRDPGPAADRRGHPGGCVPHRVGRSGRRGGDRDHAPDHLRRDRSGDGSRRRAGLRRAGASRGRRGSPMTATVTSVSEDLHQLGETLVSTAAAVIRRVPTDGMEVSLAAARVMARIQDNGPCRISDLAIQERSSQPTITNHVKRLEAAGLVQRSTDPRDARAWLIDLSPLGRQRLVEIRTRLGTNIEPMLEKLSARDRKALRAGLEVMQRMVSAR